MILSGIIVNDIIQFITKVDNSRHGQPIQQVILRVAEITNTYVRGVNAMRALEVNTQSAPYRSYKLENIIEGTVWKKIS